MEFRRSVPGFYKLVLIEGSLERPINRVIAVMRTAEANELLAQMVSILTEDEMGKGPEWKAAHLLGFGRPADASHAGRLNGK